MFDTQTHSINEKSPAALDGGSHVSWLDKVETVAHSARETLSNASWGERAAMVAAVGVAGYAIARHKNVREVAGAVEVVTGGKTTFDKTLLDAAKGVDHFVFDLDSTLTDYYKAGKVLHSTMANELHAATGIPEAEIKQSLRDTSYQLESSYFYNDLNQIDGVRKYFPGADLNSRFAGVSEAAGSAYHKALVAKPETVELFDFLRSKGKSIHVFTASPTSRALDKLTASGLEPYVGKIFTAGQNAFDDSPLSGLVTKDSPVHKVIPLKWDCKESGKGYDTVLANLGGDGSRIAMIGDNLKQDIKPARARGMFTAQAKWFLAEESSSIKPDVALDSPLDFKKLLEEAYSSK